ncbi:MAG: transposase [Mesorhizobium sp.]|uniref:transposase n=2 Tax=Mesorhizobium sp. TaxID=1871066 RepID=UPI000FEA416D|nr:transposase [Mesorhizobium sp.]RWM39657.1 MAG: IS1595 family transposase [Mesorhizobium sp.]TIO77316.1 MAG: transposase [Mesorhizobium sp.]TIO86162.1 MAG: transposase [Mesorhizobium sp.]
MKYQDGQHFLMPPECRDMPIQHLVQIGEEETYATFCQFRWPKTQGEPVCPHCGVLDCYALRRRGFKCTGCRREFSVTSGTAFAFHKLSFWKMLARSGCR